MDVTLTGEGAKRLHRFQEKIEPTPRLADTAPPRKTWLVEVLDPAKHLVAVLAANAGLDPLVYATRTGWPEFDLLPDGLAGLFVSRGEDGRPPVVAPIGEPRSTFPVYCPLCAEEYELAAAMLHAKRGSKPGKPGRFTVSRST